ncbi:hypothetical protein Agabi119p4_6868 [Agaricus bisporus var. burnettii]|uniref:Uncharacterized protein n=1 Tax=Agaricus bisporus var. burnettii TaxID=192524 RepID=A0A8H7F0A9_AGABI|nr:hypothetical protein Agabi119p4_6868 [Agaricus bisporus var. burnettii]
MPNVDLGRQTYGEFPRPPTPIMLQMVFERMSSNIEANTPFNQRLIGFNNPTTIQEIRDELKAMKGMLLEMKEMIEDPVDGLRVRRMRLKETRMELEETRTSMRETRMRVKETKNEPGRDKGDYGAFGEEVRGHGEGNE